jgi:hypothetical protein
MVRSSAADSRSLRGLKVEEPNQRFEPFHQVVVFESWPIQSWSFARFIIKRLSITWRLVGKHVGDRT